MWYLTGQAVLWRLVVYIKRVRSMGIINKLMLFGHALALLVLA